MFVATVKMKGRDDKRREIVQTITGIADQVRRCRGCVGAHCYQDICDENTFYHIQEWRSRQDLDEHLNSPLFSALLGLKTILAESPEVEVLQRE